MIVELEKAQEYIIEIDGVASANKMRQIYKLLPGEHQVQISASGYQTKDTIVRVNENNAKFTFSLDRDPDYIKYIGLTKAYKSKKFKEIHIPIIVISGGYGLSAGLYLNSLRFQKRKSEFVAEYQSAGPDYTSIEKVKRRFEIYKKNTSFQRNAAIVNALLTTACSYLIYKKNKVFNQNNPKPIYDYVPDLTIYQIDDHTFMGLTYKIDF